MHSELVYTYSCLTLQGCCEKINKLEREHTYYINAYPKLKVHLKFYFSLTIMFDKNHFFETKEQEWKLEIYP